MVEYCQDHTKAMERISKIEQKTHDTCKSLERLDKRVDTLKTDVDKRIDDTMGAIKRLFAAIMVAIIGSGVAYVLLTLHLIEKVTK